MLGGETWPRLSRFISGVSLLIAVVVTFAVWSDSDLSGLPRLALVSVIFVATWATAAQCGVFIFMLVRGLWRDPDDEV